MPKDLTYEQLLKDMESCEQTAGVSVAKHGEMVADYFIDLYNHITIGSQLKYDWKLPKWIEENLFKLLNECCNYGVMQEYLLMHDCGKPYCREVDADGKQHFPNHAMVSYLVYNKLFPEKETICELIKMDMDIHCLKGEDVEAFSKNYLAVSLLLAGLSEIHANASMFGGIESTSFKIKWKQIDKRGRQILTAMSNT